MIYNLRVGGYNSSMRMSILGVKALTCFYCTMARLEEDDGGKVEDDVNGQRLHVAKRLEEQSRCVLKLYLNI